ncbi:MAG: hypothetical protein V1843_00100 [bacterium]
MRKINKFLATMVFVIFIVSSVAIGADTAADKKPKELGVTIRVKDAPIRNIMDIFSKQAKMNIIMADDVTGTVSASFAGIGALKGIQAVLMAKGYEWQQDGNLVIISKRKAVRSFQLKYADATAVAASLAGIADSVLANKDANSVIVQTSSSSLLNVQDIISKLDELPKQVLVEAKIIEIRADDGSTLGTELNYTRSTATGNSAITMGLVDHQTPPTATTTPTTLVPGLFVSGVKGDLKAYLEALQSKTDYKLLASPRVLAINHKEAKILIGSQLGYYENLITTTGTSQSVKFLETGIKLTFTPHIGEDGNIVMDIHPEISEGTVVSSLLPQKTTTETTNRVVIKDGDTIVIGGLIRNTSQLVDKGVPILMNIPFIGALFRRSETTNTRRELIVFITPNVVDENDLKAMAEEKNAKVKDASKKFEMIH